MEQVGIVGLGQIGGSIARGLLRNGVPVIGFDNDQGTIEAAKQHGIDVASDLRTVVDTGSAIFVCVSLDANKEGIQRIIEIGDSLPVKPTITDVSSYKRGTHPPLGGHTNIVLGHPMAGSHGYGFSSSNPDLFGGTQWILILDEPFEEERIIFLLELITLLGARGQFCSKAWHDETISMVSALPHVLAIALGEVSTKPTDAEARLRLAAGSYKSATRVLLSKDTFLRDLVWYNRETVLPLIASLSRTLNSLTTALESNDRRQLSRIIESARRSSELIEHQERFECTVDVPTSTLKAFFRGMVDSGKGISHIVRKPGGVMLTMEGSQGLHFPY